MTEAKKPAAKTATKVTDPTEGLTIYERIAAISAEAGALAPEAKGGVPFAFRGIDGTVAHLSPLLNKYKVFATPEIINHNVVERELTDKQGNITGRVVKTAIIEVKYTFYGPTGDSVTVTVPGLADDFADRASAQAMSVAYRIALLQLFHLPTHTKEPEETGEEAMKSRAASAVEAAQAKSAPAAPAAPGGIKRLQVEAKRLGQELKMDSAELNGLGAKLSNGAEPSVWFNDPAVMQSLVSALMEKSAGA